MDEDLFDALITQVPATYADVGHHKKRGTKRSGYWLETRQADLFLGAADALDIDPDRIRYRTAEIHAGDDFATVQYFPDDTVLLRVYAHMWDDLSVLYDALMWRLTVTAGTTDLPVLEHVINYENMPYAVAADGVTHRLAGDVELTEIATQALDVLLSQVKACTLTTTEAVELAIASTA